MFQQEERFGFVVVGKSVGETQFVKLVVVVEQEVLLVVIVPAVEEYQQKDQLAEVEPAEVASLLRFGQDPAALK